MPARLPVSSIGAVLLVVFYFVEQRTEEPLMQVNIFKIRPFLVENLVLGISMLVFVPIFFFASEYAQISSGQVVHRDRAVPALLLPRIRRSRPRSAGGCSTEAAPSARW